MPWCVVSTCKYKIERNKEWKKYVETKPCFAILCSYSFRSYVCVSESLPIAYKTKFEIVSKGIVQIPTNRRHFSSCGILEVNTENMSALNSWVFCFVFSRLFFSSCYSYFLFFFFFFSSFAYIFVVVLQSSLNESFKTLVQIFG